MQPCGSDMTQLTLHLPGHPMKLYPWLASNHHMLESDLGLPPRSMHQAESQAFLDCDRRLMEVAVASHGEAEVQLEKGASGDNCSDQTSMPLFCSLGYLCRPNLLFAQQVA
eukprot:3677650-Amphidinium_carterae.1